MRRILQLRIPRFGLSRTQFWIIVLIIALLGANIYLIFDYQSAKARMAGLSEDLDDQQWLLYMYQQLYNPEELQAELDWLEDYLDENPAPFPEAIPYLNLRVYEFVVQEAETTAVVVNQFSPGVAHSEQIGESYYQVYTYSISATGTGELALEDLNAFIGALEEGDFSDVLVGLEEEDFPIPRVENVTLSYAEEASTASFTMKIVTQID